MSSNTHKLAVLPRPRTHWQAMDAGMLLARAHYWKLLWLWVLIAAPVLIILSLLVFIDTPLLLIIMLWWWFKPAFELPILMYLSRVIFGETTNIRTALSDAKPHWWRLIATYLSLSRLSPSRSLTAPVVFLERQKGAARSNRVSILTSEITRAYTLMVSLINVEYVGVYSLALIAAYLNPDLISFETLLEFGDGMEPGLVETLLTMIFPFIVAGFVAPLYVSAGFLLYINRRMRLEAWDIEHQFQDIEARQSTLNKNIAASLAPVAWVAGLVFACTLAIAPGNTAFAQEEELSSHSSSTGLPRVQPVRTNIKTILESKDFGYYEPVTRLRFIKNETEDDDDEEDLGPVWQAVGKAINVIAELSSYVVYFAAGVFIALVVWGLLKFMPDSWQLSRRRPSLELLDVEHHPLTRSLPEDIADRARRALANGNTREACSLLYRGALRTVMRRHALSIEKSATERECRQRVAACDNPEQTNNFTRVVNEWSGIAYASSNPSQEQISQLIDFWSDAFADDAPTDTSTPAAQITSAGKSS